MLAAVKEPIIVSNIIKLPISKLEEYLKNYDIRHQDFNYSEALSPSDIIRLEKFYKDSSESVRRIHNDDEITYYSFDHLDQIKELLNKYENKSKSL